MSLPRVSFARIVQRFHAQRDRIGVGLGALVASAGVGLQFGAGWALIVLGAVTAAYSLAVVEVGDRK